ncbi:MAG: PD40 domain-containing protein [Bacteroidales bacterium]|nr:PD40 domain-containing protein [Bacteroidales bacterium]
MKEISPTTLIDGDTTGYLKTFPSWSPDGRWLYFCRASRPAAKRP